MENKEIEQLYTVLDENYDGYAKDLMLLLKEIGQIGIHIEKMNDKVRQLYNRLQLYIRNEFWKGYDVNKHSYLLLNKPEDKLLIFGQDEFKELNAKYDNDISDEDAIQAELDEIFDDNFDFSAERDKEQKLREKKIDFIANNIKEMKFSTIINKKQKETVENITYKYKSIYEKKQYLANRKNEATANYEEILDEVVDKLLATDENFNPEEDCIMAIKPKGSNVWKLVYYKEDNLELLQQALDFE